MTGQVKEEILTRFGELGVRVTAGIVSFEPVLLGREEFLTELESYRFYDITGKLQSIEVPEGGLAFSFCQIPVIYEISEDEAWIRVTESGSVSSIRPGNQLDPRCSRALFDRLGTITRVDVGVPRLRLLTVSH